GDAALHAQGRRARLQGRQAPCGSGVEATAIGATLEGGRRVRLQQLGRGVHGALQDGAGRAGRGQLGGQGRQRRLPPRILARRREEAGVVDGQGGAASEILGQGQVRRPIVAARLRRGQRSEERRVGKECRSRGPADVESNT